jgi:HSP20 family protein
MASNGNGKTQLPVRRQTLFPDFDELRESFPGFLGFGRHWRDVLANEAVLPAVDMFERDGNVVVKAEMPGIASDKIEISASGGELRISGERNEEKEVKEENYYRSERSYGRIYRTLALPEGCDGNAAQATVKDGVLEVVIPKKQSAVAKKIEVKSA